MPFQRELNRGGQVFFLHNPRGHYRCDGAETARIAARRADGGRPRPDARRRSGGGDDDIHQLATPTCCCPRRSLRAAWIFPTRTQSSSTARDRFGLSDLYQLRGARRALQTPGPTPTCLLPRHAGVAGGRARKTHHPRFKQYSTLGSGFKIAMARPGNSRARATCWGRKQRRGQITAVGFDLYCQLLKQSVAALKGEKVKPRVEVQVRFDFSRA